MSFLQEVKEELSRRLDSARHCQLAELAAIISAAGGCGVSAARPGALSLVIQSENRLVIRKAQMLLAEAFSIRSEVSALGNTAARKGRLYSLFVLDHKQASRIFMAVKYLSGGGVLRDLTLPVNGLLLANTCCRRAFIRGAFVAAGSISDPRKSYHFEIVCGGEEKAEQIKNAIRSFGIDARIIRRKRSYVVYVKESDGISEILGVMEAPQGLMNLENIRILHGISGNVNRSVNCETANLKKTVGAAVEQIRGIEKIQRTIGLSALTEPLRQMAEVRLEYPDLPLKDLGAYLDPPVGKSGVNHRLRRLKEIAEGIK